MAASTSANASAACSCVGSMAIEGCIFANGISLPFFAASCSSASERSSTAIPGAPRQRVLSRPDAHDEVGALEGLGPLGLLGRGPGQAQVLLDRALAGAALLRLAV